MIEIQLTFSDLAWLILIWLISVFLSTFVKRLIEKWWPEKH